MKLSSRKFYAPDGMSAGVNVSGAADPNTGNTGANDAGLAAQQPHQPQQPAVMSHEDRSAAAAARRHAEAQYRNRIQAMEATQDTLARSRGFESFQDMLDYNSNELLEQGRLSPEALSPLVQRALNEHPAIRQMHQQMVAEGVEHSVQEFRSSFPDVGVNSVDDFLRLPNFDSFYGYVSQGLSYVEAYKLSHENDILNRRAAAARQATLNHMYGKGHLIGTQGDAGDDFGFPSDETLDYYRNFFPSWSEKRIRNHYAKQQKG